MPVPFRAEGVWTALVTPFEKSGKFDSAAFKRLIEFQIVQGITGLVPTGTTGESPTLSWDEHNQAVEECIVYAKDRVGILAGCGSNCTDEAIDATRHARTAGAAAALIVDCYYNGPSSLELRTEYYEQIAEWVPDIPIVPYVIPGRTGTALNAEDLSILFATKPNRFPAVKEATGDLARMRQDRALCGPKFSIMSGDDDMTIAMMEDPAVKAAGVISVMSNIVPGPLTRMVKAAASGDFSGAKSIAAQLDPLFKLVGCKVPGKRTLGDGRVVDVEDRFKNPAPVKTMMAGLGVPVGPCRRPLGKMTKPAVEKCREALRQVFNANPDNLKPLNEAFGTNVEQRLNSDGVWSELAR
ncbi:MAG TPA: 4-hydroxy-tetrahydrodipicolinate synthase [Planctomycetota bacterium]|nr:4-hydroxy-tetrahydrodipicolinate synthase [Planctomycetota bacterium]